MRPNRSKQTVHGFPTHIQSQVHSLPITEVTAHDFNTSRIFNNFNTSKGGKDSSICNEV